MKSLSSGESLNVGQKVRVFFVSCSFVFVGIVSTREGGKEGRKEVLLNEEARVATRISSIIVLCYIPGTRCGGREIEGGGSIGKGWIKGGTGRLISHFNKRFIISISICFFFKSWNNVFSALFRNIIPIETWNFHCGWLSYYIQRSVCVINTVDLQRHYFELAFIIISLSKLGPLKPASQGSHHKAYILMLYW